MNWVLIYLAVVVGGNYGVQTGMMSTGPFETEDACMLYAEETWTEEEGWNLETTLQNFYDSASPHIIHREHTNSDMGVFYTCVEIREIKK